MCVCMCVCTCSCGDQRTALGVILWVPVALILPFCFILARVSRWLGISKPQESTHLCFSYSGIISLHYHSCLLKCSTDILSLPTELTPRPYTDKN